MQTGPFTFEDEMGAAWRIVGTSPNCSQYAEIERLSDGAKSVRQKGVLRGAGLEVPGDDNPELENDDEDFNPEVETRVVHRSDPHDVYIGRPGPWGNPYSHVPGANAQHIVGTREEAITLYKEWLKQRIRANEPGLIKALADLHGKTLGCWCAPEPCHGDVLVDAAKWAHEHLALQV